MCVICRGEYAGKRVIKCCKKVREIPVSTTLEELECRECPLIKKIPFLPSLKKLACIFCRHLEEIPVIPGLQGLVCKCDKLKEIPKIDSLKYLQFSCALVTKIPVITNLETLRISYSSIVEIPPFPRLKHLECFWCVKLVKISGLQTLDYVKCTKCFLLSDVDIYDCKEAYFQDCPWLTKKKAYQGLVKAQLRIKDSIKKRKNVLPFFPENIQKILDSY
jgi:hypothetical protein